MQVCVCVFVFVHGDNAHLDKNTPSPVGTHEPCLSLNSLIILLTDTVDSLPSLFLRCFSLNVSISLFILYPFISLIPLFLLPSISYVSNWERLYPVAGWWRNVRQSWTTLLEGNDSEGVMERKRERERWSIGHPAIDLYFAHKIPPAIPNTV